MAGGSAPIDPLQYGCLGAAGVRRRGPSRVCGFLTRSLLLPSPFLMASALFLAVHGVGRTNRGSVVPSTSALRVTCAAAILGVLSILGG